MSSRLSGRCGSGGPAVRNGAVYLRSGGVPRAARNTPASSGRNEFAEGCGHRLTLRRWTQRDSSQCEEFTTLNKYGSANRRHGRCQRASTARTGHRLGAAEEEGRLGLSSGGVAAGGSDEHLGQVGEGPRRWAAKGGLLRGGGE